MAPIRCCFDQTAVWHSDAARGPSTPSFNYLVGAGEEHGRHSEANGVRGLQVDHKFELRRKFDWQLSRGCSLKDLVNVHCYAASIRPETDALTTQTPISNVVASCIDHRQSSSNRRVRNASPLLKK